MNQDMLLRLVITGDGKVAVQAVEQVKGALGQASNEQAKHAEAVKKTGVGYDYLNGQLGQLKGQILGALGIQALTSAVWESGKAVYDTTAKFERYSRALGFATGSQAGAAAEMDFARKTALSLGLALDGTITGYAKLAVASQGTSLQGKVMRDTFIGVSQAAATMGLSGEEVKGTLQAVSQMISKGTVMSEELRQQMAEHLPGAFAIAARAMGKTTAELGNMLEQGQLATTEFLPKFAAELQKTFGPGSAEAAKSLTGSINALNSAITNLQLKAGESGGASLMAEGVNTLTKAVNAIPDAKIARTINLIKELRELGWGNLFVPATAYTLATGGSGTKGDQAALEGMQSDLRRRLSLLPTSAATDEQNKQLEDAKKQYRDLISLIEQRAVTTEMAAKRLVAAEGLVLQALKATSEVDNRAAARRSEPDGYYKNSPVAGEVATAAQTIWEKSLPAAQKAMREYEAELAMVKAAYDLGTMSAGRFAQAQDQLTRATMIALNASAMAVASAYHELEKQRVDSAINLNRQALETQRADLKAALDNQFIDKQSFADRSYALTLRGIDLDVQSEQAALAAAQAVRLKWQELEGKYLDANQARAKSLEFDAKEEAIKNRIAVANAKRFTEEKLYRQQSYAAARAEFDLLNKIDDASKRFTDNLRDQREEEAFSLTLLGQTEVQQKVLTAQRQVQKALQVELNRLIAEENDLRDKGTLSFEAIQRIKAAKQAAIDAADAQSSWTKNTIETGEAYRKLEDLSKGLWDAMLSGPKAVKDWLKKQLFDWLYAQLAKPFLMQIVASVTGGGGAGGGLSGILGSLLGGGGGGSSGIVADMGVPGLAGMLGLGGSGGGTGILGMIPGFAQFANFIPVIGSLVALASILPALLKNKDGLWFDFGSQYMGKGKGASQEFDTALGGIAIRGEGKLDDVKPFVAQMQNLAKNFVDIFGQSLAEKARTALGNWTGFSNRGKGTEYENGQELAAALATESKDVMAEYFSRVFSVVDQRLADTISAWTGTTEELTKYIQGILGVQQSLTQQAPLLKAIIGETINLSQVVDLQREGEALADTFTRILNTFSLTNSIAEAMGKGADAFGEVGIKSLEARERLIALSGGLQALSGNMTTYLEQFFTEQERAAMQQKLAMQQLEAGFSALGLAVPTSREAFRALVQGIDLTTVAGQELFAALIKLAPAFASAVPAAATPAATEAVGRSTDYLNNFFTEAERAAMQLAESGKAVDDVFALLGLSVPKTRDEFRALVESQDLTTESGRKTYNALMAIAAQFVDLTAVTVQATSALADYRVSFADSVASAINSLAGPLDQVFSIIDASSVGMSEKLQRKLIAVATGIANANAALASLPEGNTAAPTYRAAILSLQQQQAALAGDLALYTSLSAQYGSALADSMYELEKWKQTQLAAAGGSAAALLAIEQTYQDKRAAILNGGVASGLDTLKSTLRAWLNGLLLNNQLTTLTPLQRLEEARAQYEAAITSGDAGKITSAADAYLREARDYFASGAGYNQIFAMVRAQVNTLANGGTVYVAPAPNTAPGTNGAGNVAGAAALAATTAANVASNAADATTRAVQQSQQVLADIMAAVKHTINDEAEAQRASDAINTAAIVSAVSVPWRIAV